MLHLNTLRRAGFFETHAGLTDEALLATLQKDRPFRNDWQLAREDRTKMVNWDMEANVAMGHDIYIALLAAFDRLAGRPGIIADAKEHWESEDGPIRVTYVLDGVQRSLEPVYNGDWTCDIFMETVLHEVEEVTGESIETCYGPDLEWIGQDVNLIRLTAAQKKLLEEELAWKFDLPY